MLHESVPQILNDLLSCFIWLLHKLKPANIFTAIFLLWFLFICIEMLWGYFRLLIIKCYQRFRFKDNYTKVFDENNKCIMITGGFGVGKTHYYKHQLRPKIKCEELCYPIEISCFSANKAELIAQIITAQLKYRVISINGLFTKLLQYSWRMLSPKNKVIVFDDFERLHTINDSYLDIIGVIDYLKQNNNKIIIIANLDEINDAVANRYFERIVDDVHTSDDFKMDIDNILKVKKIDLTAIIKKYNVDVYSELVLIGICKKLISNIEKLRAKKHLNNIRIIFNILPRLIKVVVNQLKDYPQLIDKQIIGDYYFNDFMRWYKLRYLYWHDRCLFKTLLNGTNWHQVLKDKYIPENPKEDVITRLQNENRAYWEQVGNKLGEYDLTEEIFTDTLLNKRIMDDNYKYIFKYYRATNSNESSLLVQYFFMDVLRLYHTDYAGLKNQLNMFFDNHGCEDSVCDGKPVINYKTQTITNCDEVLQFRDGIMKSDIIKNIKQEDFGWLFRLKQYIGHGPEVLFFENCVGIALLMMINDEHQLGLDEKLDNLIQNTQLNLSFLGNNTPVDVKYISETGELNEGCCYLVKHKDNDGYSLFDNVHDRKNEAMDLVSGSVDKFSSVPSRVYLLHNYWHLQGVGSIDVMSNCFLWLMNKENTNIDGLNKQIHEYLYEKWKKYLKIVYEKQFNNSQTNGVQKLVLFTTKSTKIFNESKA